MMQTKNKCAILMTVVLAALSGKAGDTITIPANLLPSEVTRPISVFDNKSSSVRDPFFPRSTRPPYVQSIEQPTAPGAPKPEVKLILKGILGSLALINNGTFTEGESRSVKVPGGQVRIRCVKINERSVLVNIEDRNEQIELRLQDK